MKPGFLRTAALLAAMLLGALVPQAHHAAWLVRWLVMTMLFVVFLQVRWSRGALHRSHAALLAANIAMGFAGFGAGWLLGGRDLALAGFFAGITPTATAAPVVVSFLRGRVEYVVAAFLLTTFGIAALLPLVLPPLLGHAAPGVFARVAGSVGLIVVAPFALAWVLRRLHPAAATWPKKLGAVSFGLWVLALFLIVANASHFLRTQAEVSHADLAKIAALVGAVCAGNFALGRLIGGAEFAREASQSLGQKNTTLTIYLAMAYASPLVALGPTCYVVWHNLWNSWQLHRARHASGAAGEAPE